MKAFFMVIFVLLSQINHAQEQSDVDAIKSLIQSIADAVELKNGQAVIDAFIHPSALIYSVFQGQSENTFSPARNTAKGLADFIDSTSKSITQKFTNIQVAMISSGRAIATTHYQVTVDGSGSHQGDEYYTLVKTNAGWKAISLSFTVERYST